MAVEIRYSGQVVEVTSGRSAVTARAPAYSVDVESGILTGGTPYGGEYTVTPGEERQILPTGSKLMGQDMVIEPIPSNYGRITYNGTSITVS